MGDKLTTCPLTSRLLQQLNIATAGGGVPDPLGGGQAEQFTSETFTAEPTATGGVVHAVLVLTTGSTAKTDLVFVAGGAKLVLDDLYCTGKDQGTTDVYVAGWLTRADCTA